MYVKKMANTEGKAETGIVISAIRNKEPVRQSTVLEKMSFFNMYNSK